MDQAFAAIEKRQVDAVLDGISIIDVDTHYSEPHDLWTSRAPASLKDRVPQVRVRDGVPSWVIDDDRCIGAGAIACSTVRPDGSRARGLDFLKWTVDDVHPSSWHTAERVKMMDACNIRAQIVYPNVLGFGGQKTSDVDPALRLASVQIYNDAMADLQADSGQRMFPMMMLPWWDPALSVAEIRRMAPRGLRGVNINSDPQTFGSLPDLADPTWDPMWAACEEYALPVNFHIGASTQSTDWLGSTPWPSYGYDMKMVLGSTMLFFANARVMANLLVSGILDRFPTLQFVSVESGIGWIPFLLEALDYQFGESVLPQGKLSLKPSEYFERNFHGCFWFEKRGLAHDARRVGIDRVMFETDFPHPTCNYPEGADLILEGLKELTWEERNKVLSLNASRLYNIPV